jgi:glutamate N-acetyltransferase/amino-acid N-acetyltransferase
MKAAPVLLCKDILPNNGIRAVVINSSCANAGTGDQGLKDAVKMQAAAANSIGISIDGMLVASTGVIGKRLPLDAIKDGLERIELAAGGGHSLAKAITTTDSVTKEVAVKTKGSDFTIGGIAKGSGMIHPQLGTMLCFLATDAALAMDFLTAALKEAADISFNMVTVDGDTSPNDTVLIMANGLAGKEIIQQDTPQADVFQAALNRACIYLARAIAADGEGAGKLIEVTVSGASDIAAARAAARTIAGSSLLKSAIHGSDPNWGRITAAAGRSGADFIESRLDLSICGIRIIEKGSIMPYDEKVASERLKNEEVSIELDLNLGEAAATAWGCDLTEEYVTINSQYTT